MLIDFNIFHFLIKTIDLSFTSSDESLLERSLVLSTNLILQNQNFRNFAVSQGLIDFVLNVDSTTLNQCSLNIIEKYLELLSAFLGGIIPQKIENQIFQKFLYYSQYPIDEIALSAVKGFNYSLSWSSLIGPFIMSSDLLPLLCNLSSHPLSELRECSLNLILYACEFDDSVYLNLYEFKEDIKIQAILSFDETESCIYALKLAKTWIKSGKSTNRLLNIVDNITTNISSIFLQKEFVVKKHLLNFLVFLTEVYENAAKNLINDSLIVFLLEMAETGDLQICTKILLFWTFLQIKSTHEDSHAIALLAHTLQECNGFSSIIESNESSVAFSRFKSLFDQMVSYTG